MEVVSFTKNQFTSLSRYQLPQNVISTECELYIVIGKDKWKPKKYLFKRLCDDEGETLGNKLLTVNTLIDNKKEIGIYELVLPEKIAVVEKRIEGFIVPFIENNINLSCLLKDEAVNKENKIKYLRQINQLLRKVHCVRKFKGNFFLGDVHEANFILNKDNDRVYAVDVDSCSIGNNQPFISKYLDTNVNIKDMHLKYPLNKMGIHIHNLNTEWFCYNIMVLNMIAKASVNQLSIEEFYLYIDYLASIGFSYKLLDCFARLYINCDNDFSEELLEYIPINLERASLNDFKCKTKKL